MKAIAKVKEEGKYKGRKPTAQVKADEVKALHAEESFHGSDCSTPRHR